MKRIFYRLDQFRRAKKEVPSEEGLARAEEILSPELFELFSRMLPFEQAHAIRVMQGLTAAGHDDYDLLVAALLHDVGKVQYPLRPWERGLAVLVKAALPGAFKKWGKGAPEGLRAGIVVAAQHAEWGAEMAEQAGANPRVVWMITNHDVDLQEFEDADRAILGLLQSIDAEN